MKSFIEDSDPEAELSVGADMRKIDCCFHLLKVITAPDQWRVLNKVRLNCSVFLGES